MKRVAVIGSGGAGKSMFARELGERTSLPVVHLDRVFWKPNWVVTPDAEWHVIHAGLIEPERWIIDGNYGSTMAQRIAAADTVIFLDLPRLVCLWGALQRQWRHRAGGRPDIAPGLRERLDLKFLWWIFRYPDVTRPKVVARLAKAAPSTQVLRIRSRGAARRALDDLAPAEGAG